MNKASSELSENNDFETLWSRFKDKPLDLSLVQAILLFNELNSRGELDEPVIDNILYALKVEEEFLSRVMATRYHDKPPNRRLVLWRSPDTSTFAAVLWEKGCYTNIHNHSHFGLTRTLKGSVTSIGFRKTEEEDELMCVGKVPFERNRVYHVPAGQSFIHSIANFKDDSALELHFYGPLKDEASYRCDPVDLALDMRNIKDGEVFKVNAIEDSKQFINRFE
jgi:predicted metal-dependent enzyme (double-stranded beta helix superfamily)